jgi:photosystem II stability/assembly factor-like uncharacterized protein
MSFWPPQFNFPIGDPYWTSSGINRATPWGIDTVEYKTGSLPLQSISGGRGTSPSIASPNISTLITEGYFNTGKVEFYWKISSLSSNSLRNANYAEFKHIDSNSQKSVLLVGGYNASSIRCSGIDLSPSLFSYNSGLGNLTSSFADINNNWSGFVSYTVTGSGFNRFEWSYVRTTPNSFARDAVWISNLILPVELNSTQLSQFFPSNQIVFLDDFKEDHISGKVYYSNNTGANFVEILPNKNWTSINTSRNIKNIVVTTYEDLIHTSFNSGMTFSPVSSLGVGVWNDGDISENGSVIVVAAGNGLYRSINSGLTWSNQLPGTNYIGTKMSDDGKSIAVIPKSGQIRLSTNSGSSFSFITTPGSKSWSDVEVSEDGTHIIAATTNEFLWMSTDAGNSWSVRLNDSGRNWSSVSMLLDGESTVASEKGGAIYISSDFGTSWTRTNNINNWNFCKISNNHVLCGTNMNNIYTGTRNNLFSNGLLDNNFFDGNWIDGCLSSNGIHQFIIKSPINDLRIKYNNLYSFSDKIGNSSNLIYGFGNTNTNIITSGTGLLNNLTGNSYRPAVLRKTGFLQGFINSGSGSFRWVINLQDTGSNNNVFFSFITGQKQASGTIEFINNTGSGLNSNDNIDIFNLSTQTYTKFTYVSSPALVNSPLRFHTLENLVTGINNSNLNLQSVLNNNKINLFANINLGASGNNIKLRKFSKNPFAIRIPNRYFMGGDDLRQPVLSSWTGIFSFNNPIIAENSGFYNKNISITRNDAEFFGPIWQNSLNNWTISTGVRRQNSVLTGLTTIQYNENLNYFSGDAFVLKNQVYDPFSGFNIHISRNNPYKNQYIGYAQYIIEISKENNNNINRYSGIIQG